MCKKLHNSKTRRTFASLLGSKCCFSSVVEHFLGKEEVPSSILGNSSKLGRDFSLPFLFYKTL